MKFKRIEFAEKSKTHKDSRPLFTIKICRNDDLGYYLMLDGKNGHYSFIGETKTRKKDITVLASNWFPSVPIIDTTGLLPKDAKIGVKIKI